MSPFKIIAIVLVLERAICICNVTCTVYVYVYVTCTVLKHRFETLFWNTVLKQNRLIKTATKKTEAGLRPPMQCTYIPRSLCCVNAQSALEIYRKSLNKSRGRLFA